MIFEKNLSKISSYEKLLKGRKMIISQKHNITYKDRMSHRQKPLVISAELSPNNYQEKAPLKRDVNDISFKGAFSLYNVKTYNLKKNLEFLERFIGKAPVKLEENFSKIHWSDIRDHVKTLANGQVEVKTKNWTRLLMEGIVYPFTELPLYIANSFKKKFTGKSFASTAERTAEQMANRGFLQKKMDILKNSDIVNSFDGYMSIAEKLQHDNKNVQSASLFTKAMKMFDPKSGNYNGVHERALTRIVTGFIPAFFLANDAYNLSRLCDDDPQKAEEEKKLRFNQETKRIVSNAYLQLITLGALSKFINSKKWVFMLVTAVTVVITEALSRLSNGRKLHFISKEEAQKINAENRAKEQAKASAQNHNVAENTVQQQKDKAEPVKEENKQENVQPSFKGSKIFQGFGLASEMPYATMTPSPVSDKGILPSNDKPLLTFSTLTKWFVGMIVAGFAMKYAKKNVKINGQSLQKYFDVISKKYDKIYSKITKTNYTISKEKFNQVITKLKEYDGVLGSKFEDVVLKYQKTTALNKNADKIAQILENEGFSELANKFRQIANKKLSSSFKDIAKNVEAADFLKARDNKIIESNLKEFFELLKGSNLTKEADELNNILFENGAFNIKNYSKAKAYVEKVKELKPFSTTFENRFKVDIDAENLKFVDEAINSLKAKNSESSAKVEEIFNNALNAQEYTLGSRARKGMVKEFTDFIIQPFKFMWGTITLPFKHIAKPIYNAVKKEAKLPKWDSEIDAAFNGIKRLTDKSIINRTPKIDLPKDKFAQYMDLQINKAFNSSTMSNISNSDLSVLAKNTSTAATAWFLMADNHNMVMLKSNGEDKDGAVLKAKERAVQETSRTFYSAMFINLFNDTFRNLYNSSLLGAQSVNVVSTLLGEYVNRKAIGMPVKEHSKAEIEEMDNRNLNRQDLLGKFFRFMSRLTGKKALTQREQNK